MENITIGIIEDDLIIAESIVEMLKQNDYIPLEPVRNFKDGLKMIEKESPDLLLIDIILNGPQDGIDLAYKVREQHGIPFIFITANSDIATVQRAKETRPYAYLIKPFNERDLYGAIEIALSAFNYEPTPVAAPKSKNERIDEFIFIKEGHLFHKVLISDVLYLESENVYINIHTTRKKYVVRSKLDDFISSFPNAQFFRVHRSYAINIKHLETINDVTLRVAGKDIPLHKSYKKELLSAGRFI